jgi:hypothetical protein
MIARACLAMVLAAAAAPAAIALDLPTRKPGLWEMTMTTSAGQTTTMSQCTDAAIDREMATMTNPMMQQMCSKNEIQKTVTGYAGESVCRMGGMTMTSRSDITGDFNSVYTTRVSTATQGAPAGMPATSDMIVTARWAGECRPGQKPGDIVMPGGMTMNIRDIKAMKGMAPKK